MKLWLLEQDENNGYDTYDSMVVAAESEDEARHIHPNSDLLEEATAIAKGWDPWKHLIDSWATTPERVTVKLLGEAIPGTKAGVVVSSFNAG